MTASEDALRDTPLEAEIVLVGELVVAASAHDRPLRQDEIDAVLGVLPAGADVGSLPAG